MTAYFYSPHTGEQILTDDPADWMGSTTVAPPAYNPAIESCCFELGAWVIRQPIKASLSELKVAKNAEINTSRLTANFSRFPHAGKEFACDELSRSDIAGTNGSMTLIGDFPPGWPGGWKAVDNTYIAITTRVEWESFYLSMCATGAANFTHAQELKATVDAATTAEEVAAITW